MQPHRFFPKTARHAVIRAVSKTLCENREAWNNKLNDHLLVLSLAKNPPTGLVRSIDECRTSIKLLDDELAQMS